MKETSFKTLETRYIREQLARAGTPGPKEIGIDEISIRKGHAYRIVISDPARRRPIRFGGEDRSQKSMAQFHNWLGEKKARSIGLAVMDMRKPFRNAAAGHAPQAAILFDKFHVMSHLGEALDKVRKAEYARLPGKHRRFIKGQKYALLSNRENLTREGKRSLKLQISGGAAAPYRAFAGSQSSCGEVLALDLCHEPIDEIAKRRDGDRGAKLVGPIRPPIGEFDLLVGDIEPAMGESVPHPATEPLWLRER